MKVVRACKRNACLRSIAPDCVSQPCPALGRKWQWYFTRNVEGAHVGAPQGLQRLIDLVCEFCVFMGMVVSVVKTKVMVFTLAFPGPFQWTCGGEQLEIVIDFKYLGILFNALDGMAVTFPMLKKNMFGAWALLKRQYGRLQCLASVGLMFRVYEACVPSTAPTVVRSGVSSHSPSNTAF